MTGGRAGARPLRTVLFTGGHDLGGIEAAVSSGADSVVIDLEEPRTPFPESERVAARGASCAGSLPTCRRIARRR